MTALDTAFLELLTSKICHDLISPIGAVNNGIEFLEDGQMPDPDVVSLITYSAQQASAKLQAFRMAYGAGGADATIKPADVHKAIEAMVSADGKIKQIWSANAPLGPADRPRGFCKILICGLLLAMEGLPKGGTLNAVNEGEAGLLITAEGPDAGPRPLTEEALYLEIPATTLDPKYVHSAMTGLLAQAYGYKISYTTPSPSSLAIRITPA